MLLQSRRRRALNHAVYTFHHIGKNGGSSWNYTNPKFRDTNSAQRYLCIGTVDGLRVAVALADHGPVGLTARFLRLR